MSKPGQPCRRRSTTTTTTTTPVAAALALATAVTVAVATAACAGPQAGSGRANLLAKPPVSRGVATRIAPASPRPLGAADTGFGLDLLGAWCRSQPRANIVFSPESLAAGLGLAYLGAKGPTAAAMARVLHLPASGAVLPLPASGAVLPLPASGAVLPLPASGGTEGTLADIRARWAALGRLSGPGVTLTGSNRVWADPSLPPLRGYLNAVATAYGAGLSRVPLLKNPAQAEQAINAAIAADTHGHIPDLLPPGALTGDAFVLTDALYLNAAWATPFQASQTQPGPFTTAPGSTATAQFMSGDGYRYATAGGWTGVRLPYRGGKLAMTALLPPAGSTGCQVPAAAGLTRLAATLGRPGPSAGVRLPKVNLASHQEMNSLLTGLGMGIAFGPGADFGGLSPAAGQISIVEHAATLAVGEKGTVGSAATGVGMTSSAELVRGPQIDFDRPYLMLVTDTATGEPLFIARVTNPASA
jgi:serpin B